MPIRIRNAVIMNTIDAFSNLYKARANLRVIEENLAQSRSRDADFANLEKNGLLARNDKLKALLQTANIELTLADVENNLKVAMVNMNIMLGFPEETVLIPDSASLVEPGSIKSLQDYEQMAVQNRKDMQAIGYRKKASAGGNTGSQSRLLSVARADRRIYCGGYSQLRNDNQCSYIWCRTFL